MVTFRVPGAFPAILFMFTKNMDEMSTKENPSKNDLILRDWLAIERTKLANERTFLSYLRTTLVLLGTGITLIKLSFFAEIQELGYAALIASPIAFSIGLYRFFRTKRNIGKYY
jgi:putative membrane protein